MHIAAPATDIRPIEHELKLTLPAARGSALLAWLRGRCRPDAEHPDGLVTSVYFDNRDLALLRAKINSDFIKQKIRVRWYAESGTRKALGSGFIELKQKIGGRRLKTRIPLDAATLAPAPWGDDLEPSFAGRDDRARQPDGLHGQDPPGTAPLAHERLRRALLEHLRRAGHAVPSDLQPFLRISFRRRRFVDPVSGSRISLDTDIRGRSMNAGLLPMAHPTPLAHAVVEVKGAHASIPPSLTTLAALGCRRESFSKYARCYLKLTRRSSF